ncbi:MAG: Regulatory protein RecX [Chlamydiae bacterium]|nr:Regulatory protein RecX [Chlamydiota bacterium]
MQSIKAKAFSLLAKKAYFSKELDRKLREKDYPINEILPLLKELKEQGWLNDEDLTARYVERLKAKRLTV